ncbi:hypothetical protein [Dyella sp. C11]|uniref:hypothetical protein n=1 Tax=Dyella sp. C11 TaxID=2126991 RepID=UPI000D64FCD5|nr:hypothetical protein [Dyella sp. C11]
MKHGSFVFLAGLLLLVANASASTPGFEQAYTTAKSDELSLQGQDAKNLHDAESQAVLNAVVACKPNHPVGGAQVTFVIVAQLDEAGVAVRTWRDGDSDMATCFDRHISGTQFFVPPHVPFYVFIGMHA